MPELVFDSKSDSIIGLYYLFSDNPLSFGFGTRAPSGLLILSHPLRQAKSTPHQNLDSTYTNEKFYENTKIKKSSFFAKKFKNLKKSNAERNFKRDNEERILEGDVLEHRKGNLNWLFSEYFPKNGFSKISLDF